MIPWWISVGMVLAVGATLFCGAAGMIYVACRLSALSSIARQRWKAVGFLLAAVLVSAECVALLISADTAGTGLAMLPFMVWGCSEEEYVRNVSTRKPSKLAVFCLVFALAVSFCEHAPQSVSQPLQRVVHHPGFIIAVWLVLIGQLSRFWYKEKTAQGVRAAD